MDGLNIVPDAIATTAEVFGHTVLRGGVGLSPGAISSTSTISEPSVLRDALAILPEAIQTISVISEPAIATGEVIIQPVDIPSAATVLVAGVSAGVVGIEPASVASTNTFYASTIDRGAVAVAPSAIAASSLVRAPVVGRGVRTIAPPAIASTAVMFNPTVVAEVPAGNWFDDPQWDRFQAIARGNDAAIWTGPKVGGKWPKRVATREEVLAIVASAGRGYMAAPNGPYAYDTAANTVRVSNDRGRPQVVFDPYPRANILFPSGIFSAAQSVTIENFRHNLRFRGSGSLTLTGSPIPGGTLTLAGAGTNVSVWTRFQPTGGGAITVTPSGDVRDVNLDARGTTFKEPDYPTIPIRTTTARVDQAAETINPGSLITPEIALNGTILLQGQLFAPPYTDTGGSGSRYLMGWEYDGRLEMQANGTIFCTAGGGNLSIPTGNTAADPFRVAVTFRERDVAGNYPADRPGICRMSVNGSAAASHEARYGSGLGDHAQLVFGRDTGSYQAQSSGAAGYDIIAFTSDLFTAAELAAISVYQT
uniref:Gp24 protein n=1 Tax=Aureimonas altamirensis TaxID=370622 RepID=A0A0P0YXA9_9HYPH|nr:Gp24 protein [Aureimonas altamirensis]